MYKIKFKSIPYLTENGFKQTYDGIYTLRFPVYFYRRTPTVFCTATIDLEESKEIKLSVEKNGQPYILWYENNVQLAPKLLKDINQIIDKKMHKIGARHYGD